MIILDVLTIVSLQITVSYDPPRRQPQLRGSGTPRSVCSSQTACARRERINIVKRTRKLIRDNIDTAVSCVNHVVAACLNTIERATARQAAVEAGDLFLQVGEETSWIDEAAQVGHKEAEGVPHVEGILLKGCGNVRIKEALAEIWFPNTRISIR